MLPHNLNLILRMRQFSCFGQSFSLEKARELQSNEYAGISNE